MTAKAGDLVEIVAMVGSGHNADLLSAAPDLLAACEAAETQFRYMLDLMVEEGDFYTGADSECASRLETIRAAIAKARGGVA